jgi:hypothetical protein
LQYVPLCPFACVCRLDA